MSRTTQDGWPDLHGRRVVVTGANSGIGYWSARRLAGLGAHVVLACRSDERGARAAEEIRAALPTASVAVRRLDLSSLASVRAFAEAPDLGRVDVLINNAGVLAIPRTLTADGFEAQLGVNHLGHFALTGLLAPRLFAGHPARVVTVTSLVHRLGRIHLDDLMLERGYGRWRAYFQSKLANLLFQQELARRLDAAASPALSVGCHPGYSATNLVFVAPRQARSRLLEGLTALGNRWIAQPADQGAKSTVHAACAPAVRQGDLVGPDGWLGAWGEPARDEPSRRARDPDLALALWERSEALTGVAFRVP